MTDQHHDTLASAAADEAIGASLQPDLPSRIAAVEHSAIFLANLIEQLAGALTAATEREAARLLADRQAAELLADMSKRVGNLERRMTVAERRGQVRALPGRS